MQHPLLERHSQSWVFQSWAAFILAFGTTGLGILYLPVDVWTRGFLWMGLSFSVSASLSLAKTVRDNHEAGKLVNRLTDAKTEKLLRDYEMKSEVA